MLPEHPLRHWVTGIATDEPIDGPVLVFDAPVTGLAGSRLAAAARKIYGPQPLTGLPVALTSGPVGALDTTVELDDGHSLTTLAYSSAQFHCFDRPTALRVTDAHDFSEFLADADRAWTAGTFAAAMVHAQAMVADLGALGGPVEDSGPQFRLFVAADGTVSTSPTGAPLGDPDTSPALLAQNWQRLNERSALSDAVGLSRSVPDVDRTDALVERPYLGRYVTCAAVLRRVGRSGRTASAVSGFPDRLAPVAERSPTDRWPDAATAPVLVRVGRTIEAHDPQRSTAVVVPESVAATVEALCSGGAATEPSEEARTEAMSVLRGADVATAWTKEVGR